MTVSSGYRNKNEKIIFSGSLVIFRPWNIDLQVRIFNMADLINYVSYSEFLFSQTCWIDVDFFWGATVITNLLSPFPCLIEWVCGGHYVYNPTLKRFFLFHFQLPFFFCGFIILHLFYLHFHSSNNPLRLNTNNKIPFFPFIFLKDFLGFILILCLYLLQTHFGISSFSHPDNALEVCGLLTPLHIVPEWYFLCQYAMLKAVPNKNAGFIILLTSIFTFFFFGEIRNLTTFTRLMDYNNGFSISSLFLSLLVFLWIGAQFPQEKFLSYGRILTLDFYFLLMCILFSPISQPSAAKAQRRDWKKENKRDIRK